MMTDTEIIEALECCGKNPPICIECSYKGKCNRKDCYDYLKGDALSLINRQKAEIERLTAKTFELSEKSEKVCVALKNAKSEAVKEFAERFIQKIHENHYVLADKINTTDYGMFTVGIEQAVKETEKEMGVEG